MSNEFGNIQGLISPHDVFEAIAGEFPDADEQLDLMKLDDLTWKASGMLDLYQLELELGMQDLIQDDSRMFQCCRFDFLDKVQGEAKVGTQIEQFGIWFEIT